MSKAEESFLARANGVEFAGFDTFLMRRNIPMRRKT